MKRNLRALAAAGVLFGALSAGDTALAQKSGGVLKIYFFDSPASMSIHEEATIAAEGPMMGVFNNLVMYKQDVPQSGFQSIVPDLATDWSWDEDKTQLTFRLREGVKWHDGKPFTAKDVVCTWDVLTGKATEKLRINPRKAWYRNLEEVVPNGDSEVTFRLKRPQPSFIALLASGFTPVYPCHVSPREMRSHPIGTGPFKFVEFKPNEVIRVTRNPDYWKRPSLSRRHRVHDHQKCLDRSTGLYRRQSRHDLALFPASINAQGRKEPGPGGDLRARAVERQPQRNDEPGSGAFRQAR